MDKEQIEKRILELQSDEEIVQFIKERMNYLETHSEEKIVGQNYTDSFRDYISQKVHYKPAEKFKDGECPDLVYDDLTPYFELVKKISGYSWYNELLLFTTVFFIIYNYLPSFDDTGIERYFTYSSLKDKQISIKTIRDNKCAFCSEKAGMAHNLFKFLGIDSEVVCGGRDNSPHAYNFVYPNGYGNEPMVLYDPSHFISLKKGDKKYSFGFYKALRKEEYEDMKKGKAYKVSDLEKTKENYIKLYGSDGKFDGFEFEVETPTYIYGLENFKNLKDSAKSL